MTNEARALAGYIQSELLRKSDLEIDESTPLLSSGLIDSFALVDLLLKLQEVTGKRISAGRVQPKDMDTIALMLSTAQRVGKLQK